MARERGKTTGMFATREPRAREDPQRWELHAAYVQANMLQGFRYLDLSGVVLNKVADRYRVHTVDPGGTVLRDPVTEDAPYQVRFGADRIWLHYAPLESLAPVLDTAAGWIQSISTDIEVTRFSRLGLRIDYFHPVTDLVATTKALNDLMPVRLLEGFVSPVKHDDDAEFSFSTRFPVEKLIVKILINSVHIMAPWSKPGDYESNGVSFALDVYEQPHDGNSIRRNGVPDFLERARAQIEGLVESIGVPILQELNHG